LFSGNYVHDFEASPGFELNTAVISETKVMTVEIVTALERWDCAKLCIDHLGDDGCLAFDVCQTEAEAGTDYVDATMASDDSDDLDGLQPIQTTQKSVQCRITTSYIGTLSDSNMKVKSNENCTLYASEYPSKYTYSTLNQTVTYQKPA
jgi:hypothetical protein